MPRHLRPLRALLLALTPILLACDAATAPDAPPPTPTTLVVTPTALSFTALGQTQSLSGQVRDQNGNPMTGVSITWVSSSSSVADVSATGDVTSRGNGTATVTASAGTVTGTAVIQVAQVASGITLSNSALAFPALGQSQTLSATVRDANANVIPGATVVWSSSAPSVAEVSASGVITARANGSAQITARSGETTVIATVQVAQVAASVAVSPANVNFDALGDTRTLTAEVRDANANPITGAAVIWSTSAASTAEVSAAGVVTARRNGSAQVTARSGTAVGTTTVQVAQAVAQVVRVSGDQQEAAAGAELPQELVVETRDRLGSPVPGATVNFSVTAGGGSVIPAVTTTNAAGRATTRWRLGASGAQGARATAATSQVTFSASITAAQPPTITNIVSDVSVAGVRGVARSGTPASDPAPRPSP